MPRRYKPPKRPVTPDPVYNSDAVACLTAQTLSLQSLGGLLCLL